MLRLIEFLYRFRIFLFFIFLELIAIWLLTSYNQYYNAYFFNSSNAISGSIQEATANTIQYSQLREVNSRLAKENAKLREQLLNRIQYQPKIDTINGRYVVISARVVNNDFSRSANYLTLNRGTKDGVSIGMGVISDEGVVGTVKSMSENFCTVTSLLHQEQMVSSQLLPSRTFCTTQWNAAGPLTSKVKFLPRHVEIEKGDSIVTSGFNAIFPPEILIGTVKEFELKNELSFYDVTIDLANDFTSLTNLYLLKNELRKEMDSLLILNE